MLIAIFNHCQLPNMNLVNLSMDVTQTPFKTRDGVGNAERFRGRKMVWCVGYETGQRQLGVFGSL